MSEIQQGRYDALLRRVADLKGPGSKVNDVLEELFPMFDVENLPGELYILAQTDLCFGGGRTDGIVAQAGRAQLFNPEGSGKVLTITEVGFSVGALGITRWGRRDTPLTTDLQTQLFRDTRKAAAGVLNLPTGQIRVQTSVALANATGQTFVPSATPLILSDKNGIAVLGPNTGFEIGTSSTNQQESFYFNWRERVAEPSETNF